jgi:hypothetical protein
MSRHASAEELAGLDLDALKPRKAAKIRAHVSTCVQCTQLSSQVSAVPATLASMSYPGMPASVSARLDTALASESSQRLASAPATEAGRRDLPDRRLAAKPRRGRRLPGMSVLGTRLVAAAGALAIVAAGGYEIATHTSSNVGGIAASSSGSAAAPSVGRMSAGASVQYGQSASAKTVQTVHAATNFTAAGLGTQALAAIRTAKLEGVGGTHNGGRPAPSFSGSATNSAAKPGSPSQASMASCLDGLVGSSPVQLVEMAKFDGQPATIIVSAQTAARPAEVWAVTPSCSASHTDVLDHLTLSRT